MSFGLLTCLPYPSLCSQRSHSFHTWNDIYLQNTYRRQFGPELSPETLCLNDNGRKSNVWVVGGGDEIRHYFDQYFEQHMVKRRPSAGAHEWAMRLGATHEEAINFTEELVKQDDIWDYLSGLVSR